MVQLLGQPQCQGGRQSSGSTRLLLHSVPWDTCLSLWVTSSTGGPIISNTTLRVGADVHPDKIVLRAVDKTGSAKVVDTLEANDRATRLSTFPG
jgi:hypothetical protein